ncbi:hypothetical protein PIB30_063523 [Stylosanthes scabra]|uniref:Uncharacterized protein n=1 Tax=Stylosanthes scabra TaxID=79078 RepID=A0ABU6XN09_9FABA|nr:hypothetical protein [Stylosanthes scabra]
MTQWDYGLSRFALFVPVLEEIVFSYCRRGQKAFLSVLGGLPPVTVGFPKSLNSALVSEVRFSTKEVSSSPCFPWAGKRI